MLIALKPSICYYVSYIFTIFLLCRSIGYYISVLVLLSIYYYYYSIYKKRITLALTIYYMPILPYSEKIKALSLLKKLLEYISYFINSLTKIKYIITLYRNKMLII